jgi:hypothetical protein
MAQVIEFSTKSSQEERTHVQLGSTTPVAHISSTATWLLQEAAAHGTQSPLEADGQVARTVVFILFIASGWSFGVMIDRGWLQRGPQAVPLCSGSGRRTADGR